MAAATRACLTSDRAPPWQEFVDELVATHTLKEELMSVFGEEAQILKVCQKCPGSPIKEPYISALK
jgi:hypothetical protein